MFRIQPRPSWMLLFLLGSMISGCAKPAQVEGSYAGYIGPPYGQKRGFRADIKQNGSSLTGEAYLHDGGGSGGSQSTDVKGELTGKMSGDKLSCEVKFANLVYTCSGSYAEEGQDGPRFSGQCHYGTSISPMDDTPFLWRRQAAPSATATP